jgi:signal peptidase I
MADRGSGAPSPGFATAGSVRAPAKMTGRHAARIMFWVVLCAALAALIAGVAVLLGGMGRVTVASASMADTLRPGDLVLYRHNSGIRRGDLVIERLLAAGGGGLVVRRVIGLPGDHVTCCAAHGRISINGAVLDEGYLYPGDAASARKFSVALTSGEYWLLGDHRGIAFDSRSRGPVPTANVAGRAVMIVRGGSYITVRTPQAYVADHLAPADTRATVPAPAVIMVAGSVVALIALAAFGTVRAVIRRRRLAASGTS